VPDDGLQADDVRPEEVRLLNGSSLLPELLQGIKFIDGVKESKTAA